MAKLARWKEKCRKGGLRSVAVRQANALVRADNGREEGMPIGTLEWRTEDGGVMRWRVYQGPRRNNIRVVIGDENVVCGWDELMTTLREKLAPLTRQAIP